MDRRNGGRNDIYRYRLFSTFIFLKKEKNRMATGNEIPKLTHDIHVKITEGTFKELQLFAKFLGVKISSAARIAMRAYLRGTKTR